MHEISAFILAGGKSSRMGADKAFLELQGRSLLARALELAREVATEVNIVGDPAKFAAFGSVIEDVYSGHGPLAGIHAALVSSRTDLNLVIGVDLPFLDPNLLGFLVAEAQSSRATVTVPIANGHYQTLCAAYRKEFASMAELALREGRNKIDALFPKVPLHAISEDELKRAGFTISAFRNLNTPEDWDQAKHEFGLQAQHVSWAKGRHRLNE